MTAPGKGGRKRKWRSDADRVRAYRARQRGEKEPATFEAALVDGDDLARAVEHSRQLQAELVEAIDSLAETQAALTHAERRRHLATQRKLDRVRADLDGTRSTHNRQREALESARQEIESLRTYLAELRRSPAANPTPTAPNRAARREAAKRERPGH